MQETHPVIKKLNFKDQGQSVLILNPPKAYEEVIAALQGEIHHEVINKSYEFVQVFGTTNAELQRLGQQASNHVTEDGLLWLCYPKKASKIYKGSDCSRESVTSMLANQGVEPVRQVAIDDDWSALRFRKPDKIKKMTRKFAVTELGKERTEQ
jgi:hypothetical protein